LQKKTGRKINTKILFALLAVTLMSCGEDIFNLKRPKVKYKAFYNIIKVKDIPYAKGLRHDTINSENASTMRLMLDAYVPDNDEEKRPAILLFHGGAFISGSKENSSIVNMARYFAARGWVVFSINYRLKDDKGTVPDKWIEYAQDNLEYSQIATFLAIYPAVRDAKAALRWVSKNAYQFNIDTRFITVGGGSAGAIIANAIGVTNRKDYTDEINETTDPTLETTNREQMVHAHTVLDFWGSKTAIEALENIYGYNRYNKRDAPVLIAHGTDDPVIPFTEAEDLRSAYRKAGIDIKFCALDGFGHNAWDANFNGKSLYELSFNFIVRKQKLRVE
jgi:para-nitrobenzyl esterase